MGYDHLGDFSFRHHSPVVSRSPGPDRERIKGQSAVERQRFLDLMYELDHELSELEDTLVATDPKTGEKFRPARLFPVGDWSLGLSLTTMAVVWLVAVILIFIFVLP